MQNVFTGPSSALYADERGHVKIKGKPPIASKMNWDGVNLITIVYVAVLVRDPAAAVLRACSLTLGSHH